VDAVTPVVLLLGAGLGAGVLLLILALRPADAAEPAPYRLRLPLAGRRAAGAVACALAVLALTRWVAVAAGVALLVTSWPALFGGGRDEARAVARIEALATWTESLRDMVATGIALPDALPASIASASPLIGSELLALAERVRDKEPLDEALLQLADALDDATADHIVAALVLNVRAQGRQLKAVLTALSRSARAELQVRRQVEAERRAGRTSVRIMMAATVVMTLGLYLLNRDYVQPYGSLAGQVVLSVVVALYGTAFAWMRRLAAFTKADRFLRPPTVTARAAGGPARQRIAGGAIR
jgi:Flp pilus assembly protein TadB